MCDYTTLRFIADGQYAGNLLQYKRVSYGRCNNHGKYYNGRGNYYLYNIKTEKRWRINYCQAKKILKEI